MTTAELVASRGISVAHYPNPLSTRRSSFMVGAGTLRLITMMKTGQHEWPRPTVATVDGVPWLRERWDEEIPDGAVVEFRSLPRGGNASTAGYITAGLEIAAGIAIIATTGGAGAIPGYVLIGGGLLSIYATSQIARPKPPSYLSGESGSPTYDIAYQSNRKRIGETIPVAYGQNMMLPDLIAAPYSRFFFDNDYIYILLCLGVGEFYIDESTLKFGQAPFSQLVGIQYQILNPGDTLNLDGFYDNVAICGAVNGQGINGPANVFLVGAHQLNIYNQLVGAQNYMVIQAPNLGVFSSLSPGGGDTITITGTAHNDGTYMVWQIVGGGFLTVQVPAPITAETWSQFKIEKNQVISKVVGLAVVNFSNGSSAIGSAAGSFPGLVAGDWLSVIGTGTADDRLYSITTPGSSTVVVSPRPPGTGSYAPVALIGTRDAAHGGTTTIINPALPTTVFTATGSPLPSTVTATAPTITSIPGIFSDVLVGDKITVSGSASNNGDYFIATIATDLSFVTVTTSVVNETATHAYIFLNGQGWSGWFAVGTDLQTIRVLEMDIIGQQGLALIDGSGNAGSLDIEVDVQYQGLSIAGTGAGYTSNGGNAIGDTSIPIHAGTGTVPTNCVVTFAGDTTNYTVTAGLTGGAITISPPLVATLATGTAMTVAPAGTPAGSPILFTAQASAAQTTAYRRSFPWNNLSGFAQVQVRFRRTTPQAFNANNRSLDVLTIGGIRGYCDNVATLHPGTGSYPGYTCLAIKALATAQLTAQQTQQVNLVATRKIRTWTGSAWTSPIATRSIAWALADMLQDTTGYGAGLPDAQVDIAALYALETNVWSPRGDTVNGVFDQSSTFWEQLTNLARAGRCQPVLSDGIVTFVRDSAATTPVALFTAAQMTPGSLSIQYLMPQDNDPDGTSVAYIDPTTWAQRTLDVIDGGGTPTNPQTITLFGITSPTQALYEATYLDRVRKYQRKTITFTTEMDGHLVGVGDLIGISHDVPEWGQSSELVLVSGTTFTSADPLDWSAGGTFYAMFRKQDGSTAGPLTVTAVGGHPEQFTCTASLGFTPSTDLSAGDRTTFVFGPGSAYTQLAKVQSVTPAQGTTVQIVATPYQSAVYAAGA